MFSAMANKSADICTARTSLCFFFFFSSRRRHTRLQGDWSSDVCSSDLGWLFDVKNTVSPQVLLAQYLRRDGVLHVKEPAGDSELPSAHSQVAEGEHGRIGRRIRPGIDCNLLRIAWHLQGIEALGDNVEDARVLKVGVEHLIECSKQRAGAGINARGFEVCDGDAHPLDALCNDALELIVLGVHGGREKQHAEDQCRAGWKSTSALAYCFARRCFLPALRPGSS